MRYAVALVVAAALITIGVLLVWHAQRILHQKEQESVEAARQQGNAQQPGAGIAPQPGDFGTELTPSEHRFVIIGTLLATFWYVLIPLTIGLCLLVAAFVKPANRP